MRLVYRESWGAVPARPGIERLRPSDRDAFMVHHSTGQELGRIDTAAWVREIQRFHLGGSRGWSDIGYHFLIDRVGQVYEGRGWDRAGAHCPGYNERAFGVCFLGNDDAGTQDVTTAARLAFRGLYDDAQRRAGRALRLLGHRDVRSTACPGDELYAWLQAGMPAPAAAVPPRPAVTRPAPPAYPLPRGYYYGPRSGPRQSVSGYGRDVSHATRRGLATWQTRMRARGWAVAVDGLYGPQTGALALRLQRDAGLQQDALIGPATWRAAWTS